MKKNYVGFLLLYIWQILKHFALTKSWAQTSFFWRMETVGKGPPAVSRLRTCGLKNVSLTLKVLTAPPYHPLPTKYLNQQQFGSCFVVDDQGTLYSHGSTAWLSLMGLQPFFQIPTGVASKLQALFQCMLWVVAAAMLVFVKLGLIVWKKNRAKGLKSRFYDRKDNREIYWFWAIRLEKKNFMRNRKY